MVYLSKYQSPHHHNSPTLLLILQNIDQEKRKRGAGSYFWFQLNYGKHFTKSATLGLEYKNLYFARLSQLLFWNDFLK